MAKIAQELALELEEDPQHPGDDEDDLTVGDIEKKRLTDPLSPLLQPLGMAGEAETPSFTREGQQTFCLAARTPDPGSVPCDSLLSSFLGPRVRCLDYFPIIVVQGCLHCNQSRQAASDFRDITDFVRRQATAKEWLLSVR